MRVNVICYLWVEALKLSWTIIYSFSSPALMTEKAMLPSWFSSKMAEHVRSKSAYGEELPSAPCKTWSRSNKNAFLVLRQQDGGATRYRSITQSTLIHNTSQLQFPKNIYSLSSGLWPRPKYFKRQLRCENSTLLGGWSFISWLTVLIFVEMSWGRHRTGT